ADSGGHEAVSSRMTNLPSDLCPKRNFDEKNLRSWDDRSLAVSAGPIASAKPDYRQEGRKTDGGQTQALAGVARRHRYRRLQEDQRQCRGIAPVDQDRGVADVQDASL